MRKLYPGATAIIVGANKVTENIGRQVKLIGFVPPGEVLSFGIAEQKYEFEGGLRGTWVVQAPNIYRHDVSKGKLLDTYACIEPHHLLGSVPVLQARTKSA